MRPLILLILSLTSVSGATHRMPNKFDKLRATPYFVDKTELIYTFFDSEKHFFISCPPKFGKSTILDMIDLFSQIEVDKDYKPRELITENYAHEIFTNLRIGIKRKFTIISHLCRHPVIHLKLSDYPYDELTPRLMTAFLNDRLKESVARYDWIFNLPEEQLNFRYDKYATDLGADAIEFMKKMLKRQLTSKDIHTALEKMSQILYRIFYSDVVILIDDYDHPFTKTMLNCVRENNNTMNAMSLSYNILNVMLAHAIKHLRFTRALMSGVNSIPFETINPLVSEYMQNCRFLEDHYFSPYFGFVESDMGVIYQKFNCTGYERRNVQMYYGSYKTHLKRIPIYPPHSVVQYFLHRPSSISKMQNILRGTSRSNVISPLICRFLNVSLFRHEMVQLLQNIPTTYHVDGYHRAHLDRYLRLMNLRFEDDTNINTNVLLTFLFDQGFLSYASFNEYVLPNFEIRHLLETTLQYHYIEQKLLPLKKIAEYLYKMLAKDHTTKMISSYTQRLQSSLQFVYETLYPNKYDPPTVLEYYYLIYTGLQLYNTTKHILSRISLPIVVSNDDITFIPSHVEFEIPLDHPVKGVVCVANHRGEQIRPKDETQFLAKDSNITFFRILIDNHRNVSFEMERQRDD